MPAPIPARSTPLTRLRFEDHSSENVSAEYGPFDNVRVTAVDVRVDLTQQVLAHRINGRWHITGDSCTYEHLFVWEDGMELLSIDLPVDEQRLLERLHERGRAVEPQLTRADILRAALLYAETLPPDQLYEAVQRIRAKDRRAGNKTKRREKDVVKRCCSNCNALLKPEMANCDVCGKSGE